MPILRQKGNINKSPCFRHIHDRIWKSKLASSTKGGYSYCKFKPIIRLAPYLTLVQNRKQRVSYSKLRLCDHKLKTETLHHKKFKDVGGWQFLTIEVTKTLCMVFEMRVFDMTSHIH